MQPFSNGTEFMMFNEHYCCRCRKYDPDADMQSSQGCEIEKALALASVTDGEITADMFAQMGGRRGECKEFEEGEPETTPEHDDDWADYTPQVGDVFSADDDEISVTVNGVGDVVDCTCISPEFGQRTQQFPVPDFIEMARRTMRIEGVTLLRNHSTSAQNTAEKAGA